MATRRTKLIDVSLQKPHFRYVVHANITFYPENSPYGRHFYKKFVEMCMKYNKNKV